MRAAGLGAAGMGAAAYSSRRGQPGLPGLPEGIPMSSYEKLRGEVVPGEAIEISSDEWEAIRDKPNEPFQATIPFIKDFKTGFLIARFFTQSPDGYKYWKIAGTTPNNINNSIKKFITYFERMYSVQGSFNTVVLSTIKDTKVELETIEGHIETLKNKMGSVKTDDINKDIQVIELLEDRKRNLLEELDAAIRIKGLGFK